MRAPFVESDRLTDVIKRRADERSFRKLIEDLPGARKVVGIDRVRVVVEARDQLSSRRTHELVAPTARANLVRAAQNSNSGKRIANRILTCNRSEERRVGKECRSRW